jgi:23S rRNA maturation mini-RNase III
MAACSPALVTGAAAVRPWQDILTRMIADFGLTEEEQDWLRRGRNASGRGPRRLDPKVSAQPRHPNPNPNPNPNPSPNPNPDPDPNPTLVLTKVYRAATAFETLLGYLHLADQPRLEEVFEFVWQSESESESAAESAAESAGGGGVAESAAEDGGLVSERAETP